MQTARRKILSSMAAVAAIGVGTTQVFGQSNLNIGIQEVNYEGEYVVFVNSGSEDADISGYIVAFEYGNDGTNQRRPLGNDVVIPAGETLTVATGAEEMADADVTFDYEGSVLRNDETDIVALLTADGEMVVMSEETPVMTTTTTTTEENGNDDSTTTDESDDGDSNSGSSDESNEPDDGNTQSSEETKSSGSTESSSEGDSEDDC